MEEYNHVPVLLNETIEGLNIKPDGIYVDCTMCGAGHSKEILKRLSANGKLVCFDQDDYAIKRGTEKLQKISTYKVTLAVLKKWRKDGIISEHEFRKCELKIAEKFDISLCSIYRETA